MDEREIWCECVKFVIRLHLDANGGGPYIALALYQWVLGITDTAPDTLEVEYGQPYGIPSKGDLVGSGKALMN